MHSQYRKEVQMPALQIRDVPEEIYNQYKRRCAEEDRSMAQQTLRLIKKYLANEEPFAESVGSHKLRYIPFEDEIGREERIAKRKALFERIDKLKLNEMKLPDGYESAADMIREDRDNDYGRTWFNDFIEREKSA